ncbi:hypothetical protein AUEXF2481DRAFT_43622 [Aureobasidium subglaciale EXF-2481]|uniref:Uncharacterized protein n=1 Tax=Aureobasidium subglaciale (strain EXF-2481) TaxID=1043005 RepID=A0A074YYJ7_AURSE|nr:uncharacterized protein AUEXF2481DRAFT_43622 [Aureobasidium subglaciale EXF-2481]KEQ91931.1 hypothetical protein AUEXF2481DRAFT_43622 [Aureobasidium subglaciale EXF-2481]
MNRGFASGMNLQSSIDRIHTTIMIAPSLLSCVILMCQTTATGSRAHYKFVTASTSFPIREL